jgi:hypothetical protein
MTTMKRSLFFSPRSGLARSVPAIVALAGLTLGLPAVVPSLPATARAEEPPAAALEHAGALSKAFRYAAEKATPSVVVVRSESKPKDGPRNERGGRRGNGNPFKGTPFEDMFPASARG